MVSSLYIAGDGGANNVSGVQCQLISTHYFQCIYTYLYGLIWHYPFAHICIAMVPRILESECNAMAVWYKINVWLWWACVCTTCPFRFVEMAFCIELSSIGWALTNRCLIDGLLPLGRFFLTHYIGGPLHIWSNVRALGSYRCELIVWLLTSRKYTVTQLHFPQNKALHTISEDGLTMTLHLDEASRFLLNPQF